MREAFDREAAKQSFFAAMQHIHLGEKMALLRQASEEAYGSLEAMAQLAASVGLKAKVVRSQVECSHEWPIPALARMKDGNCVLVGWSNESSIFLFDPRAEKQYAAKKEDFTAAWTGELLLFTSGFDWRRLVKKYNLDWFYTIILRYKKQWREVLLASFVLQLFGLVTPLFTQVVIDKVLGNRGVSTLDVLGLVLVVLGFFQCAMGILRNYFLTHTTNKLDVILGSRLFRHLVALPLPYFEHRRVGDTMMRIGALASIREFLTGTAITVVLDVFFAVVFVAVMFWFSPLLTLVALLIVPLYLFLNLVATPIYQKKLEAVWATSSENNAFMIEAVTGMQTLKALAVEPQFNRRWEQLLAKNTSRTFDSAKLGIGLNSLASILQVLSSMLILWVGGHLVMDGELTLGQLIAFQMLAGQANAPLMTLIGMWQQFQQSFLAMDRLSDVLNTRTEPVLAAVPAGLPAIAGAVAFENLSFRYRLDLPRVLEGISFSVPAGAKVGIVGRSGSGKSTLTKLLQYLYIPEEGMISIDGQDVSRMPPGWLRSQIGVVLQENYLYNASVRDNIAIPRPGATMEEVVAVAKAAGAHEFILELPEGYDTKVGERGASLSGGQRQRIAIARSLLTNPRILIFDEATSALDYESERIIMRNLAQIAAGRTLLMIAHRLSTVAQCDVILVMEKGQLVEAGTHEELLALGGLYRYLYDQQEG